MVKFLSHPDQERFRGQIQKIWGDICAIRLGCGTLEEERLRDVLIEDIAQAHRYIRGSMQNSRMDAFQDLVQMAREGIEFLERRESVRDSNSRQC